ncbi:hypothetical protein EAF04_010437 [Stromatinia cepivora]|nr:hypothetical protein EAF04_010437 [Stromatinia cepivora]
MRETFSYVCGHVTTVVEHRSHCTLPQTFNPYRYSPEIQNGSKLYLPGHLLRACRWAGVRIAHSKCMYCQAVEYRPLTNTGNDSSLLSQLLPLNTWISDPGVGVGEYKVIPPAELQLRRAYWDNYVSDQAILFQRQHHLQVTYQDALKALANYDVILGQITYTETRKQLSWNITRANMMQDFYDLGRNLYLGQVRSMGALEVTCLFDPMNLTSLTHDLLHLVKPEEIPSGEICGICREALDSPEQRGNVTRVFCGSHLFHHKCIAEWFDTSITDKVSCPMCRRTCTIYRPLLAEWYPKDLDIDDSDIDDLDIDGLDIDGLDIDDLDIDDLDIDDLDIDDLDIDDLDIDDLDIDDLDIDDLDIDDLDIDDLDIDDLDNNDSDSDNSGSDDSGSELLLPNQQWPLYRPARERRGSEL